MTYKLTRQQLVLDLHVAYQCAKRHKASRGYVIRFEKNLECNIETLADELMSRTYKPQPSSCFIIERPKKREVFAAQFRDRVVHHLYFNYTHEMFERTFIQDTYSCIENRGTHYGIERLKKHIRRESSNYTGPCYVLKLDIRGYFMHIDRAKLLQIATASIRKMSERRVDKHSRQVWEETVDIDFVLWLTENIINVNPTERCRIVGKKEDWEGLDAAKSLANAPKGCGLPIGNLTSQLFSNVYLNVFDQYMKRNLRCKCYGRYVDDAFVVCRYKDYLHDIIPSVREFLRDTLSLDLHMGKTVIVDARHGVEFLGGYVKRFRTYVSNASLARIITGLESMDLKDTLSVWLRISSWLGVLGHYDSLNIRSRLFLTPRILKVSYFDKGINKMLVPKCD